MKDKTILIAGGTGFIGFHLAKECKKVGLEVSSLSSKKPKKGRKIKGVKYFFCDISKKKKLKKEIKNKYNYVVNLSGHVDHVDKKKVNSSHNLGTKNLINLFIKNAPDHFIQIGSSAEYGKLRSPNKESFKCKPKSIYGLAKFNATKYALEIYRKYKFPITILRLYQAYGPQQDKNRLIPIIIDACKKNKKFNCSHGNKFRDYIYITDVTNFILKVLQTKKTVGQILNLGSGKKQKIKNIINTIKKYFKGGNPQFGVIKLRKDEPTHSYPDLSKNKKFINWKIKVSFNKGLKKTMKYYE